VGHIETPESFPIGRQARLHVMTLEPFCTRRRVWSYRAHGDTGALPCRVAGPVACGDDRALPHQERVWSHKTRGDTGALLCWVACLVPQGT
jgi:hypothetical protein